MIPDEEMLRALVDELREIMTMGVAGFLACVCFAVAVGVLVYGAALP